MITEQMVDEIVVPTAHDAVWSHDQAVFLDAAQNCGGTVHPLLDALEQIDPQFLAPLPGLGHTAQRLQFLSTVAATDVTAARVLEPHLDAVAILAESRESDDFTRAGHTWGCLRRRGPGVDARRRAAPWSVDPHGNKAVVFTGWSTEQRTGHGTHDRG